MKRVIALFLVLVVSMTSVYALADAPTFTVNGTASVMTEPDMVSLTAQVSQTAVSLVEVQQQIAPVVETVRTQLKGIGLAETDIVTTGYDFSPNYTYDPVTYESKPNGFSATHTLSITCRDISLLDQVITILSNAGVTEMYNIQYDISNRSELYREALSAALLAANEKAMALATAAGYSNTELVSVVEKASYSVDSYSNVMLAKADAAAEIPTGIRSGSVSVTAEVTASYEAE